VSAGGAQRAYLAQRRDGEAVAALVVQDDALQSHHRSPLPAATTTATTTVTTTTATTTTAAASAVLCPRSQPELVHGAVHRAVRALADAGDFLIIIGHNNSTLVHKLDQSFFTYAMLCNAMLCYAMLCHTLCCAMLCHTMLCFAMPLCYAIL
jgi:hypothetical protein